jgi:hypothetical protein
MIEHMDTKSLDQISGCRNLLVTDLRAEGPIVNRPGLTAWPIVLLPFRPHIELPDLDKPGLQPVRPA